ncbi:MAG: hypothetical protein M1368_04830 [Thaumarchaeota archaeon]|nr:hypothetical protein [Nitrososphaerota archaeon]
MNFSFAALFINRRISKMIEDNVMYLIPVRNVKNALGILCSYLIRCEDSSKREIDGLLKSEEQHKIDFALQNAKGFSLVSLLLNNVSEAEQFQGKFRKVKGVKQVYMNMLNDFIFVDSWLEEILERNANP